MIHLAHEHGLKSLCGQELESLGIVELAEFFQKNIDTEEVCEQCINIWKELPRCPVCGNANFDINGDCNRCYKEKVVPPKEIEGKEPQTTEEIVNIEPDKKYTLVDLDFFPNIKRSKKGRTHSVPKDASLWKKQVILSRSPSELGKLAVKFVSEQRVIDMAKKAFNYKHFREQILELENNQV